MSISTRDKKALQEYREKCLLIQSSTGINPNEGKDEKAKRIEKAKNDYRFMVEYYFPHYAGSKTPDFHVRLAKKVKKNKKYKGWVKWGRALAKSVLSDIMIPMHLWMNNDIHFMVLIGQNETKAQLLLSDLQAEFESNQRLINDFGNQVTYGSWESGFFKTKSGFIAKALGMGQDPRGLRIGATRPDYIVCDDWETRETVKNPKRQKEMAKWLLSSVIPTMDGENRRVLIAQNHFAPQMIFSIIMDQNKNWDIDQVNAYNPVTYESTWADKYPPQYWMDIEKEIGTIHAHAEYNNEPHVEGTIFTDELFQYGNLPPLKSFDAVVGRWDVAYSDKATADFNAVAIWAIKDGVKYKLDCFTKQCKMKVAIHFIADRLQYYKSKGRVIQFGFEAQFWNDEIKRTIQDVEEEVKYSLNLIKVERSTSNKYDRILSMLPSYQNGRVVYSSALKSNNDHLVSLSQLKGIEPGYSTKDDGPDCDEMCFEALEEAARVRKHQAVVKKRVTRKY